MKERLLIWIGGAFFYFCLAKYILDKYGCDMFTIIDADNEKKTFFEEQKLVDFKETWFYRDFVDVNPKKNPAKSVC